MEKTIAFLDRPQLGGAELSRSWEMALAPPHLPSRQVTPNQGIYRYLKAVFIL
jgi:hypothetical protein